LASGDNANGVLQACGWMTGFPMRTAFGRLYPEHNPWQYDARRLINDDEADCALWISAYRAVAPGWKRNVPLIALSSEPGPDQHVYIQVGRPALDHDAVEHDAISGMIVARAATHPSALPSVAAIIARIAAALHQPGPWPC
jgi:formylmethanofuran dehydrogenase subunit B